MHRACGGPERVNLAAKCIVREGASVMALTQCQRISFLVELPTDDDHYKRDISPVDK